MKVLLAVGGLVAAAGLVGWADHASRPKPVDVHGWQTTGLRTDRDPMTARFHRFGEAVDAHWVSSWRGSSRDLVPYQDNRYYLTAVLRLTPGQVARLIGTRTTVATPLPGFTDAVPADPGLPGELAPHTPDAAAWVTVPALEPVLVRARQSRTYFDPAGDTVLVSGVDVRDPDEPVVTVDPWGNTTTTTPSPFAVPS
ncbi:hypothetical protein ACIQBJ_03055 [Kitasatospora sp. NPDC088391]|uniref:hypothetical protein n=1 Tax=Kitasatospora sp. NPDC088391 TaxID=3364074 RepID=UPI00381DE21F